MIPQGVPSVKLPGRTLFLRRKARLVDNTATPLAGRRCRGEAFHGEPFTAAMARGGDDGRRPRTSAGMPRPYAVT
jgi:hypothetical protein